jgi:hypothetical protein
VEFTSPDFFATDANLWAAFLLSRVEERFPDAGPGTTRTATDQD